jgi:UDP-N-acetylglucosamine:LPS N-acetylglucosamine transferase
MKKIIVTFVEAGFGHITPAIAVSDAIKNAVTKEGINNVTVDDVYIFRDSGVKELVDYEKYLIKNTKKYSTNYFTAFWQFATMHLLGGPQRNLEILHQHYPIFRRAKEAFYKFLDEKQPDIVIATHYGITHFVIEYNRRFNKNIELITYVPDVCVHGWWDRRGGTFIVNNQFAKDEALKKGHNPKNIKLVPFITRKNIIDFNLTKAEARAVNDLPADKFTILLADGAYAMSKLKSFTKELLRNIKQPVTIIACAAKNVKLLAEFNKIKDTVPAGITFVPVGFRWDIYELYRSADIIITKAGGTAVMDCMFMETPIIVNRNTNPLEKANMRLIVDKLKCGEFITNKKKCRKRVTEFMQKPELLDAYRENIKKNFNRADEGSKQIAEIVLGDVG